VLHIFCWLGAPESGEVPERSKGAHCKSAGAAFGGSNPPLSTIVDLCRLLGARVRPGDPLKALPEQKIPCVQVLRRGSLKRE
jgi:hypothetical protein